MKKLNQRGLTIVELLVTMIVAVIIVSSLTMIITNNTRLGQRSRDMVLTNAFAEAKMESLRSQGYIAIDDGTTTVTPELPTELKAPRNAELTVTTVSAGLKRAVLTISYGDQGVDKTYSYTTLIGELGVGQN